MVVLENTPTVHNAIVCTLCSCYPWPVLGLPPNWYKDPQYRAAIAKSPREVLARDRGSGTPVIDWRGGWVLGPVAPSPEAVCDALMPASSATDDERWMVIGGRRWRRTDPSLPDDLVEALTSHLGRGRSGVGAAKRREDDDAVALARRRVDLAKHGLGERGPRWWEDDEGSRLDRAQQALRDLDRLDECP